MAAFTPGSPGLKNRLVWEHVEDPASRQLLRKLFGMTDGEFDSAFDSPTADKTSSADVHSASRPTKRLRTEETKEAADQVRGFRLFHMQA